MLKIHICDWNRLKKRELTIQSLDQLLRSGSTIFADKSSSSDSVDSVSKGKVVLESDGFEVDDEHCFKSLAEESIPLMYLSPGQEWSPDATRKDWLSDRNLDKMSVTSFLKIPLKDLEGYVRAESDVSSTAEDETDDSAPGLEKLNLDLQARCCSSTFQTCDRSKGSGCVLLPNQADTQKQFLDQYQTRTGYHEKGLEEACELSALERILRKGLASRILKIRRRSETQKEEDSQEGSYEHLHCLLNELLKCNIPRDENSCCQSEIGELRSVPLTSDNSLLDESQCDVVTGLLKAIKSNMVLIAGLSREHAQLLFEADRSCVHHAVGCSLGEKIQSVCLEMLCKDEETFL